MRLLRRRLRFAVVLILCVSLSVDPASACHWLLARWSNPCAPSPSYCVPVSTPCYAYPTEYVSSDCCGDSWHSSVVETSSDCGCGEVVVHSGEIIHDSGPWERQGDYAAPSTPTPTWAGPEPPADRAVNKPRDTEQLPDGDMPPALADDEVPADVPPPPMEADVDESADDLFAAPAEDDVPPPADEPAPAEDDLFAAPAEEPAIEEPAMEEPADDLFGAPADEPAVEEPAMEEPADDLFGAPAEEPAMEEPADDLFGAPADEPAAAQPAEAEDDLFGAPAAEPAMEEPAAEDDLFGEPAADTATEEPAEAEDDLFGAPAAEPATEEPAAQDDLFGAPANEPAAEEPAMDDLFGAPAEAPADAESDDLFGAPNEEPAPAEQPAEEEDDLFGDFGAVLEQPGGLSSLALRHWVDNTGNYTVDARLIAVVDGHVRLLKANGRTTTVALSRLSEEDLSFVNRQAAAQQAKTFSQTAQR